ncbi:hypothetical protein OS347_000763 [Vibrio vulnificus]|nr:hypothetical protein [Vibrio vulnificus]
MILGDFIQKANLQNIMIIAGIIFGSITAYNQINANKADIDLTKSYMISVDSKINELKFDNQEHKLRIASLENNNTKFDKTLNTVNNTLLELNGTIAGLKATVESMKEK